MSRWSLIVAFFAVTSAWSQQSLHASATNWTANSPESVQAEADSQEYVANLVTLLAQRGDAHALLAAALYATPLPSCVFPSRIGTSVGADLWQRARNAGSEDAQVWWASALQSNSRESALSHSSAIQQLIKIAPKNAAVWMLELEQADNAGDEISAKIAISRAAEADYFDDYFMAITSTLLRAAESESLSTPSAGVNDSLLDVTSQQKFRALSRSVWLTLRPSSVEQALSKGSSASA